MDISEWTETINKRYKSQVVGGAALNIPRLSSGSISLDLALGGGWPFGRGVTIVGEYSTGKSLMAQKACVSVSNYDHVTKRHLDFVPNGTPGKALYIDIEGTIDLEWAKSLGLDFTKHVLARPEYAEAAIDIITTAIQNNLFDVIVLDSVASLTPAKELEESAENNQVGLAAKLLNKGIRIWQSLLITMQSKNQHGPVVILANQYRLKPNTPMGMDPRVMPCGKGQGFFSSVIVTTQATSYDDRKDVELAEIILKGAVPKNKTAVPKQSYEFSVGQRVSEDLQKGEIDNFKVIINLAKEFNLLHKSETGSGWKLGAKEFATQKEIIELMRVDPKFQRLLWRSIIAQATGYVEK